MVLDLLEFPGLHRVSEVLDQVLDVTQEVNVSQQYDMPPQMDIDVTKSISATMHTSSGDILLDLFPSEAPKTVNNFVFLAREGFYDEVIFHRIIEGFMIQGGDPTGTGTGGPGYRFDDEPVVRDYLAGTLAMANSGPNTNGSQFFIMHRNGSLPKNYTIFGNVRDGMDVVDALANLDVKMSNSGELSSPVNPPTISGIEVTEG